MAGKLDRLKIVAFNDINRLIPTGFFDAYFNPESYKVTYNTKFSNDAAHGASSVMPFMRQLPKTYSFELKLDGTGVSGPKIPVPLKVQQFIALTYQYKGDIHRPPFLIISWGSLVAKCVLESLDVNYTYFSPSGIPLRATLTTTFKESESAEDTAAGQAASSPDLTHVRTVKEGDTLPLMCQEIYRDPSLFLKVAKFNNLTNYRTLTPGTQIQFPPLA